MKKTIRAFALLSALSLTVAPTLRAGMRGTNPRPQIASSFSLLDVAYTIFTVIGL